MKHCVRLVCLLLLTGTVAAQAETQPEHNGLSGAHAVELHKIINRESLSEHTATCRVQLEKLYLLSSNRLLWSQSGSLTDQAIQAIKQFEQAELNGLRSSNYLTDTLKRSWNNIQKTHIQKTAAIESSQWVEFDVAISLSLMHFVSDLYRGMIDPLKTGFKVVLQRKQIDLAEAVMALSQSHEFEDAIQRLEPRFRAYQRLKQLLSHYRQLNSHHQWQYLSDEKTIRPGDQYQDLDALRALLTLLSDYDDEGLVITSDAIYDDDLVEAVEKFQRRHGLEEDGVIGRLTFAQLNTPLSKRIDQIELALERLRWLPVPRNGPHIVVNIPAFELHAFEVEESVETTILKMGVIVGSAINKNETPVFAADMKYIFFRPYWNVPYSITVKELLPKIKRDPYYLSANHYEVVQGQRLISTAYVDEAMLTGLRAGYYQIRQRPGAENALGLVKFIFPNSNNVYLHDTPAQKLFSKSRRDFSHGCIRVEDPVTLADFVLGRQQMLWDRTDIVQAMHDRDDRKITLTNQIPVHIFYTTTIVRDNGDIAFFDDIYGHDKYLRQLRMTHQADRCDF